MSIKRKIGRFIPDVIYLKYLYRREIGKPLNLKHPQTFSEKLQWLKIHNRKPVYTRMVDKYQAKEYVADMIGEDYIIPTIGVWEQYDEIDFDRLPNQFVLKCTHDSGGVVIVKDKKQFDSAAARKKIEDCLRRNFYWVSREWPYKNVKPRIIAEKYMSEASGKDIRDFKFLCFNGRVEYMKVDFDRFTDHHANFYDRSGSIMDIGVSSYPPVFESRIELKPKNEKEMIQLAEILSKGFPFLRVDFYEIDGKVYFGELTFYPDSGLVPFTKEESDIEMGRMLKLPNK